MPVSVRQSSRRTDVLVEERSANGTAEALAAASLDADTQRIRELIVDMGPGLRNRQLAILHVRALARSMLRLASDAVTDPLTGLRNRRGFMRDGSRFLAQAAAGGRFAVVVFVDVDGLKQVNDECGHAAGDELLHTAGRVLAKGFRATDIVARISGDEFGVVALAKTAEAGPAIRERLNRALQRLNAGRGARPLQLSVGFAAFDPARPETLPRLLAQADRLMYRHKRAAASAGARR